MGLYIFFLPLKYKAEYTVLLFPRERKKELPLRFLPWEVLQGQEVECVLRSQLVADIVT